MEINFETGKNLSGSDDHDDNDDDFYNEGKKLRDMYYLLSSLLAALTRRGTLLQMTINITITITNSPIHHNHEEQFKSYGITLDFHFCIFSRLF